MCESPIAVGFCAETERMIYWETNIIGASLIHKREKRHSAEHTRRTRDEIERGLQLRPERRRLLNEELR